MGAGERGPPRASLSYVCTRHRAEISMWVSNLPARPLALTALCPATAHARAAWPRQRATRGHQGGGPLGEVWGSSVYSNTLKCL